MGISVEWREVGSVVVLDLAGESSIMDGTILQQAVRGLTKAGKRYFILNLQGLRHLDSFGLGQLVSTFITVRDLKGDVKLVSANPAITNLLRYTRIDTVMRVFPTEAEALAELTKTASTQNG